MYSMPKNVEPSGTQTTSFFIVDGHGYVRSLRPFLWPFPSKLLRGEAAEAVTPNGGAPRGTGRGCGGLVAMWRWSWSWI